MSRITGIYSTTTTPGEAVRAFVLHPLPSAKPPLDVASFATLNQQAELALARLSAVSGLVPSMDWLLYSAVRKEALLTSQIEGTQATLTDLFDDEAGFKLNNTDDVAEISNYLRAFRYAQAQLRSPDGLPLSARLLREAHRLLLDGARGAGKQPGELRQSQNWIGGTRPGNAVFVPPPPERVADLLGDLEKFIHAENGDLPPLVKIALVHAQFETIHPFLDGNGRIGRLLIAALLEHWGLLAEPLMYLSGYLKQHQAEYYRRLSDIRLEGDWEAWVAFFLEGVAVAAGRHRQPDCRRPQEAAGFKQSQPRELSPVRVAAHNAALHHRACPAMPEHHFAHCDRRRANAGRIGHRGGTDRTEEESQLRLSGLCETAGRHYPAA